VKWSEREACMRSLSWWSDRPPDSTALHCTALYKRPQNELLTFHCGRAIASTMPGSPAPDPTSMTVKLPLLLLPLLPLLLLLTSAAAPGQCCSITGRRASESSTCRCHASPRSRMAARWLRGGASWVWHYWGVQVAVRDIWGTRPAQRRCIFCSCKEVSAPPIPTSQSNPNPSKSSPVRFMFWFTSNM